MSIIKSVTCPVCGCLCDDIELTIADGAVAQVKNGCAMCEAKFFSHNNEHRLTTPLIRKDGKLVPISYDEAIQKSAKILADANYPILYGWSSTDCEAQRIGVALAEEVGGVLDNTAVVCHGPSILGVQDVGIPTCTLGQVRHRADLRFEDSEWKSYLNKVKAAAGRKKLRSLERKGILKERHPHIAPTVSDNKPPEILNKKGRKLIVVDVRKSMTAEIADYFLQVEYGKDYELIQAVRALVRDQELDVEKVAGVPVEYLQQLADAMISCEFGVIFFGMGLTQSAGKFRNIDVAISLVRDLNMRTKFVILPMRGHFNVTGANTVFTWQSGYPYGVDFSIGYPRYNPGETTVVDILMREESDAGLVIASDPVSNFPRRAVEHLVKNPLIVIDPHMNATSLVGDIIFPSSIVGIEKEVEKEGTAYRMDHVPLPLKKVVDPPEGLLSDEEILTRILIGVRKIKLKKLEVA